MSHEALPIDAVLEPLRQALQANARVVLLAPPGAGKTTRAPLALLDSAWLAGKKILMLEPRRIAARAAARRMAQSLGEEVGETVGYRVRMDSKVGPRTRIEVITDGVFTRMIQDSPDLDGVGAVLFDEFHERSLEGDLGLALCLEAQDALRPDLRLMPMSATLDGAKVAGFLGDCPVIESQGRAYPVETLWRPREPKDRLPQSVARVVREALRTQEGSILAFLPGTKEIRQTAADLSGLPADVDLVTLYGDLSGPEQDRAIRPPPPGRRKIVLATAIAETSLTIDGVRVVVDAGQMRAPRFDPGSGMTRLATFPVPRSNADQRRGRAGRTAPGVCYRLWSEQEDRALSPFAQPEIVTADLTGLALELALWGQEAAGLRWIDPPPSAALGHAHELLQDLGALDRDLKITPRGRAIARLPAHPRLAAMLLSAADQGDGALACLIAALLGERDLFRGGARDPDLRPRVAVLMAGRANAPGIDPGALASVKQREADLRRRLKIPKEIAPGALDRVGELVAMAYPDRIAKRRPGADPRYLMLGGRGAALDPLDSLASEPWLAIADLDGGGRESRVWSAAPIDGEALLARWADRIETTAQVVWDDVNETLSARRTTRLGPILLREEPLPGLPPEEMGPAVIAALRQRGVGLLSWSESAVRVRERLRFAASVDGAEAWPDVSDTGLAANLEDWLAPAVAALPRLSAFGKIDLGAALLSSLTYQQRRELDHVAPERLTVPSGSSIAIDYAGETPVAAVKLQEMFGARVQPSVGRGRVPLLLHLLSPAGRPIQVTRDIGGFWTSSYQDVRKDLRGRYPKHPWPEDPLTAIPTRHVKARMA